MVSPAVLFDEGWTHRTLAPSTTRDSDTGELVPSTAVETEGTGLVQEPLWTGYAEVTPTSVRDERVVMFLPTNPTAGFSVGAADEFYSPEGHCWQAITDGMPRRIPGHPPAYWAARVRREKGKDRG